MQCLQQSGLFIKFLGIKPRIVVMACKIWESMGPHWPRTPKEVIHSWDWASYLFACGIYWVNGCSIIWQLKLNSCYILYSYILKCSVVIIFLWIFFRRPLLFGIPLELLPSPSLFDIFCCYISLSFYYTSLFFLPLKAHHHMSSYYFSYDLCGYFKWNIHN